MLLSEKDARALTEKLLSYVKADDAVIGVGSENYSHLRFAANAFTTSGARENTTVGVTVWIDRKRGSVLHQRSRRRLAQSDGGTSP